MEAKELIKFLKSLGLDVHTTTKARGNQGFYSHNRIDISKDLVQERVIPTLLHEFAHYIHSQLEPQIEKNGGSVEKIFDDNDSGFYQNELLKVTRFVDKNSKCEKLEEHKKNLKTKITDYEKIIKTTYPNFQRSKRFKEFDNYIKNSNAKYLLKYDRVKLIQNRRNHDTKLYTIDNIEKDFCDMPKEFAAYIRLKSCQKRQSRISAKINRMNKYYTKPTELFARLVEGLYINSAQVKQLAPNSTKRFYELLECGYYKDLYNLREYFMDST